MEHLDVLVVGAGLSGIGAGHFLQAQCPWATYAIAEARDTLGGTWDLFRYPGIRSDSDMFTLGYSFRPWERGEGHRRRRLHPPLHPGHRRRRGHRHPHPVRAPGGGGRLGVGGRPVAGHRRAAGDGRDGAS